MNKLISKWLILQLSALWLAWELIANFDHNATTWPLTYLIKAYVPVWVYFPAVCVLAGWLVWHFRPTHSREGIMSQPVPSNALVKRSAVVSALRTFGQGLAVAVIGAVAAWVPTVITPDTHWTREYTVGLGLSLAGVVAMSTASYVHGLVSPRKVP